LEIGLKWGFRVHNHPVFFLPCLEVVVILSKFIRVSERKKPERRKKKKTLASSGRSSSSSSLAQSNSCCFSAILIVNYLCLTFLSNFILVLSVDLCLSL
jgi:hypothetical protein